MRDAGGKLADGLELLRQPQLLLEPALGRDVEDVALDAQGLAGVVGEHRALLAHRDRGAVARNHAVLAAEVLAGLQHTYERRVDAVAIVRVDDRVEEVLAVLPRGQRIAEHRLDLRAHVQPRPRHVERVAIDDQRQVLDERPVAVFALQQQGLGVLAQRDVLRLHDQLTAVAAGDRDLEPHLVTRGMAEALLDHDRRAVGQQLGERAHRLLAILGIEEVVVEDADQRLRVVAEDPLELRVDVREAAVESQHRHSGVDVHERTAEVVQSAFALDQTHDVQRHAEHAPHALDQHLLLAVERILPFS